MYIHLLKLEYIYNVYTIVRAIDVCLTVLLKEVLKQSFKYNFITTCNKQMDTKQKSVNETKI